MNIKLNSLYICVKDMKRSIRFYEELFGRTIDVEDDVFSIFNLDGFRYCLFNNTAVHENVVWGDNCLPSFEVDDMDELLDKLKKLESEIVFPLTKIKDNWVMEFKDSEGNDIEVYCKAASTR